MTANEEARVAELQAAKAELAERTAELQIINSVQEALASQLSMQSIYDLVGDKLREAFGYEPSPPNWEGARQEALARLEKDLPPELCYHNLWHTCDDVLPAVQRLAVLVGLGEEETRLVETAALYHDIGFTVQRQEHELVGAEIVGQILPGLGFTPAQIVAIQGMIMATQLPQSPRTVLEEILADADLDVLGREDFVTRNEALREELAVSGIRLGDERWYSSQLHMLQNHHYWTAAAQSLRGEGKQKNIERMKRLLAQAAGAPSNADSSTFIPGAEH